MKSIKPFLKLHSSVRILCATLFFIFLTIHTYGQNWSSDGNAYYRIENDQIVQYTLPANTPSVVVSAAQLTPQGSTSPLKVDFFSFSIDQQKVLVFTNTKRVWRLNSRGDYWVLDLKTGNFNQVGKSLPSSSLMFAKFSPDAKSVAYVSENNIYVEDLATAQIKPLTTNGSVTLINGTFDWVYEEEFNCRDGFRWSPDSKSIGYWQLDASSIKKFYMINNTDNVYAELIPLEYPKVGETPSIARVGVVTIADAKTTWMNVPGAPDQNYIVRMEFIPATNRLLIQQLNRKQNKSTLYVLETATGSSTSIHQESDEAWIDVVETGSTRSIDYTNHFMWSNDAKSIWWISERDGWRHLYQVGLDGKSDKLITKGDYDIIDLKYIDEKKGYVYFMASPDNATQQYLYRTRLNGTGKLELLSPADQKGTHDYSFSTNGKYAQHSFSNHFTRPAREMITVEKHKPLNEKESIAARLSSLQEAPTTEFFRVTTKDGVEMDGWMVKPKDFDPGKKYPVVFFVYTEPASTTVNDRYGVGRNRLYIGNMRDDGYIYISLDNRGTPAPKGRAWRKSIYRQIGRINIHDQAMAATEILKWKYVDPERIAVWGWSGGGSATLNLMFKHPEIYKTGISIAAVANQLTYDNIYQERFMGLPQENREDFIVGSPMTHAKNLQGNLLYIHGTGDDNVHYQNADILVNELIKYNKQFQFMPYPNRSHSISEGEGTGLHLSTLYTNFLKMHCPPGAK
jgi:dipeptidyl-peptidase-4